MVLDTMEIIYKNGDLLKASERVRMHGCNAKGVMGAGIAALIRQKYPIAYLDYHRRCVRGEVRLGDVFPVDVGDGTIIINAITQDEYGGNKTNISYKAVRECMFRVNILAQHHKWDSIAMPKIGAGLAGGKWGKISEIIETELVDVQPVVYLFRK
jgi:O-acetyl-ADP-ribose deacetylase (regulator of RNase III)